MTPEHTTAAARLAVDIGGTFTDLVLALPGRTLSAKALTTHDAPERAVLEGAREILGRAGLAADALGLVIHGTTLATNALIERKGARTALVTTEGFRDSLEIAYEHRFEQYDLYMEGPNHSCRGPGGWRCRSAWPPTAPCCCRWTRRRSSGSASGW